MKPIVAPKNVVSSTNGDPADVVLLVVHIQELDPGYEGVATLELASEVHLKADREIGAAGAKIGARRERPAFTELARVANAAEQVGPAVAAHDAGRERGIDLRSRNPKSAIRPRDRTHVPLSRA